MLDLRGRVLHVNVGEGVRAALVAEQQGIALGEVAGVGRTFHHFHLAAIAVLAAPGADALADDGAAGVLADVNHLRAGVGLLAVVRQRDGVEFALRIVAEQNAARIFPGDGGAGLDLRPGNLRVRAFAEAALGDEVVDAALAVLVAGIPVLDGAVFDLRALHRDEFDDGGVELVFVAHRGGAAFEIADVSALVRDDERPLELAGVRGLDAKVGGQLHRAADPLGDVAEGTVGEDGGVQRGVEVVRVGHDGAEILLHQFRVVRDCLGEGTEDDPLLGQFSLEGRCDGNAVHDGVHGHAGETLLFVERDAEFVEGLAQLGVNLVERVERLLLLGRGVVADGLVIRLRVSQVRPLRLAERLPVAKGLQSPLGEPRRLVLLGGDEADGVLAQARRDGVGLDVRDEAVFVVGRDKLFDGVGGFAHGKGVQPRMDTKEHEWELGREDPPAKLANERERKTVLSRLRLVLRTLNSCLFVSILGWRLLRLCRTVGAEAVEVGFDVL